IRKGCWYELMRPTAERLGFALKESEDFIRELMRRPPMNPDQTGAVMRLPDWAQSPAQKEEERPRFVRPSLALGEQPARAAPGRALRFARGLLVHALLARLPETARDDRERAARRYLAARSIPPNEA